MCDLRAALSLTPGSPLCGGALAHARFAALCGAPAPPGSPLCGGALAHARFAALWRRSRLRPARRFVAPLSLTLGSPPSVYGGGLRRRQRLFVRPSAALPLAPGSPLRCGGFRRQRLFVRPSAALSLAPVSPLCGGALAHARLAASVRRFPAAKALCATFGRRSRPRSVRRFVRRFPAAAKALCATFGRRSRSRPARRFAAAVSGGGKGSLCDLSAPLSLTLGSPPVLPVLKAVLKKMPALLF